MFYDQHGHIPVSYGTNEIHNPVSLFLVHSSSRLIQEKKSGLAGQSSCNLQLSLVTIGKVLGYLILMCLYAHKFEKLHTLFPGSSFLIHDPGGLEHRRPWTSLGPRMHCYHDVLKHGQIVEEPYVLECSGDAHIGYVIRLQAIDLLSAHPYLT